LKKTAVYRISRSRRPDLGSRYGYVSPAASASGRRIRTRRRRGCGGETYGCGRPRDTRKLSVAAAERRLNPAGYIRLALVSDSESTAEALHRLVEILISRRPHEYASDRTRYSPGRPSVGLTTPARRLRELTGLSLIALSGVAAAALMTWSVQDLSLSYTPRADRTFDTWRDRR
jgi:hypothetical protein